MAGWPPRTTRHDQFVANEPEPVGLAPQRALGAVGAVPRLLEGANLAQDRWHHTLTILGKGHKPAVVPLPPRTVDAVRSAVGDRQAGPLLLPRHSLDRHASYTVMQFVSGAS